MSIEEDKEKIWTLRRQLLHAINEGNENGMTREQWEVLLLTNIAASIAVIGDVLIEKMRMEDSE